MNDRQFIVNYKGFTLFKSGLWIFQPSMSEFQSYLTLDEAKAAVDRWLGGSK